MGAKAQWAVIYLNPSKASSSVATGVADGQQVGRATVGGIGRASLWRGSAGTWVDLQPAEWASSVASGVGGGQQVGYVIDGAGVHHASLWTGSAGSWVDLHPAGAGHSLATGVDGGLQVGYVVDVIDGVNVFRAGLWYGTAGTWVNLHPNWATESRAMGVGGGHVAGFVVDDAGVLHASLWTDTAGSWVWVDLHPAVEGVSLSSAHDVGGDQVVGYAKVDGYFHAGLWNRTADSWVWVDLHPPGVNESSGVLAVDGGEQVGIVYNNDPYHAALWRGTPDSYVDLHAFLSRDFEDSLASGIWHDAKYTYVVGYGYNTKRQRQEALMWRAEYSTPAPPAETGAIEGRVFAPNGSAVKGALVTATDPAGNQWETTSAGKQGSYTLTELPAGVYTVEGIKDGVGYAVLDGVQVIAGETTSGVDLHLLPY